MSAKRLRYLPLQGRLALAYVGLALLVSASLTAAIVLVLRAQMRRHLEDHLRTLVGLAAVSIDGDTHRQLQSPKDETSPAYAKVQRQLRQLRIAMGGEARYIYTMRQDTEGRVVFVVDAETDTELVSHLGDVYADASPWLREHIGTLAMPSVEPGLNADEWGTWMSGFAPITTSDQALDGVLGIDVPATAVLEA